MTRQDLLQNRAQEMQKHTKLSTWAILVLRNVIFGGPWSALGCQKGTHGDPLGYPWPRLGRPGSPWGSLWGAEEHQKCPTLNPNGSQVAHFEKWHPTPWDAFFQNPRVSAWFCHFDPKREPMGSPRLPKWGQNYSKILPKFVPNSIRFFDMFLDHFGRHFGSQNEAKFVTFSIFWKKS